jgi:hypothetical protein
MVATRTRLYASQEWVAYSASTGTKVAEGNCPDNESLCAFDAETHQLEYSVQPNEISSPAVARRSSPPFSDSAVFALCGWRSLCGYSPGGGITFKTLTEDRDRCSAFFAHLELPGCLPIVAGNVIYNITYEDLDPVGVRVGIVARSFSGKVLRRIHGNADSIIVADGLLIASTGQGLKAFSPRTSAA